jgi:tRNA threonylcarbamoyladenosine biosynthesis protein TsaE
MSSAETTVHDSPESTYDLGRHLASALNGGEIILLYGGLGAGKTLFTKGIMDGLGYDVDEVTSPSFALVNLYQTKNFDVYHIDLWRLEPPVDVISAVGLEEILEDEDAVLIIEWADRLATPPMQRPVFSVTITGSGDAARVIEISRDSFTAHQNI